MFFVKVDEEETIKDLRDKLIERFGTTKEKMSKALLFASDRSWIRFVPKQAMKDDDVIKEKIEPKASVYVVLDKKKQDSHREEALKIDN